MKANSLILILFCFFLIGSDTPEAPKVNWSMDIGQVIITAITTIGAIVIAWVGFKVAKLNSKVDTYHTAVNGKMGELLEVTKKSSKAEGKLEAETDAKASESK